MVGFTFAANRLARQRLPAELEVWEGDTTTGETRLIERYQGPAGVGVDAAARLIVAAEGSSTGARSLSRWPSPISTG